MLKIGFSVAASRAWQASCQNVFLFCLLAVCAGCAAPPPKSVPAVTMEQRFAALAEYSDDAAELIQSQFNIRDADTSSQLRGAIVLKLVVVPDGTIVAASIVNSSRNASTDDAAIAAAHSVGHLAAVPREVIRDNHSIDIEIPVLPSSLKVPATPPKSSLVFAGNEARKSLSPATQAYFLAISRQINVSVQYPRAALIATIEGNTEVRVTLGVDGAIRNVELIRSSGHTSLDVESIEVFSRISKFPPIPDAQPGVEAYVFDLPLSFSL
jgi:TonB family protein